MEIYKIPIETALAFFPFIAFILTIPFLIYQYNKYGAIPKIKCLIFYSLILYLICAYFMVILPLPSIEVVSEMNTKTIQLIPFNFIKDIQVTVDFDFSSGTKILEMLNKPTIYTVLFNVLLTIPYGIYLKYFFNKKWYQVILYSFSLSLFFELTQLTGLYGIYPRAYRMFDVDDLIINTLGGLIGFIICPLFELFLPSKEELENISYEKGKKVTLLRRAVALTIDLLIILIISLCLKIFLYNTRLMFHSLFISINIYYLIYSTIAGGKTIGKKIVNLKVEGINKDIKWYRILLRNFIFTNIIIFPFTWIDIIKVMTDIKKEYIMYIYIIILIIQIANFIYYIITIKEEQPLFIYERITNTKNISTIIVEKDVNEEIKTNDKKSNVDKEKNIKKSKKHAIIKKSN